MTGHVLLSQIGFENDVIAIFRRHGRPLAAPLAEVRVYDGFREGPQSQRAADKPMRGSAVRLCPCDRTVVANEEQFAVGREDTAAIGTDMLASGFVLMRPYRFKSGPCRQERGLMLLNLRERQYLR